MNKLNCRDCCFCEKCRSDGGCDDYFPYNDYGYVPDSELAEDKEDYYWEWVLYVSEFK